MMTNNINKNKELIKKHPYLLPKYLWTDEPIEDYDYSFTLLDDMPDGWRKAFGEQMCDEITAVLKRYNFLNDYRIIEIKEKYGCYDKESEVLTKNGWKFFKDVSMDDEICTLDKDGETIIYQKPTDIIAYKHTGKMYYLQNRGVSICVTPNHNLYVAKGSYYYHKKDNKKVMFDYQLCTPDKYFGKDKRFKKDGKWIGVKPKDNITINGYSITRTYCTREYNNADLTFNYINFLRFLGFYIAEGCSNYTSGAISIAYNYLNLSEMHELQMLINGIGFTPKNGAEGVMRIYSVVLSKWLYEKCGHKAWNKRVPDFIKNLPPSYIEEFLKYLFYGDGHLTKTAYVLTTTSKQLCDDVQELLFKCGYSSSVFEVDPNDTVPKLNKYNIISKHKSYNINWLKNSGCIEIDNSKAKNTKSFYEEWINYNDYVYCVTVPNHVIYIRRKYRTYWCGNSLRWYDNGAPEGAFEEINKIIHKYENISERTCIRCGKPATKISLGWISPYCDECAEILQKRGVRFKDID